MQLQAGHSTKTGKRTIQRQKISHPATFLSRPVKGILGIVLGIAARAAFPRFSKEGGWHMFKEKNKSRKCFVHPSDVPLDEYFPPKLLDIIGGIRSTQRCRKYSYVSWQVFDVVLGRNLPWQGDLEQTLASAMEEYLEKEIWAIMGDGASTLRQLVPKPKRFKIPKAAKVSKAED